VIETSNPSGTHIFFLGNGKIIASVHESIFIKIGPHDKVNPILQVIVSTAVGALTGAASGALKGGVAEAVAGAGVGAVKGAMGGAIKAGMQQV
ncbi:10947_t:CDS:1, partial [Paraglomus occultum]